MMVTSMFTLGGNLSQEHSGTVSQNQMTGTTIGVSRLIKIPSSFNKLREESNDNDNELILTEDNTPIINK